MASVGIKESLSAVGESAAAGLTDPCRSVLMVSEKTSDRSRKCTIIYFENLMKSY